MIRWEKLLGGKKQQGELLRAANLLLALRKLLKKADDKHDGHVTLMRFTTGWKVVFGTPNLDGYESYRKYILSLPAFMTLHQAINHAMKHNHIFCSKNAQDPLDAYRETTEP